MIFRRFRFGKQKSEIHIASARRFQAFNESKNCTSSEIKDALSHRER